MTNIFRDLQQAMNDDETRNNVLTAEMIQNACLYQIATSLNEIDKTLKHIETELKGIKGRV